MAERSNRTRRERLKYGMCLNEECEKCKTKEIQAIPMRKDFVCPTCGKELRECPPPKKGKLGLIIGIIAALVVLAILIYCCLPGKSDEGNQVVPDSIAVDTTVVEPQPTDSTHIKSDTLIQTSDNSNVRVEGSKVIEEHVTSTVTTIKTSSSTHSSSGPKTSGSGSKQNTSLTLSYGKYKGEVQGGYPNGMGRLTYTKSRQINRYDSKGRTANEGDYVIGEFENGFLVQGKHYDADNNLVESLIIGSAPDGVYESK